ncbi:MAG: protease modulator HflC [Treponema sp.]|nr:protease modulator HflC [Treponema sp.]
MKKNKTLTTIIVLIVLTIAVFVMGPLYVINEGEQAVVVQFGRIVNVVTNAGLHIKVPFIDEVVRYPKRIMAWNGEQRGIPTLERQYIIVDVTARWRIANPQVFYESIGTINRAYDILGEIINSEVRTVVAENYFHESVRDSNIILEREYVEDLGLVDIDVEQITASIGSDVPLEPVSRGRRQLSSEILTRSRRMVPEYGIELIDVVTRQIRYSDELTESVYARMIRERNQIAQAIRSEGEGRRANILGQMERDRMTIMSTAEREAQSIMAAADAEAARIYATAYSRDRSFFEFWRAIESYRLTMPGFDLALSTDPDYFRFLYSAQGNR